MKHKAGFVNIIGNPNVGKSTLMNLLVGEPMAIATAKAQTTRHRLLGMVNDEKYQIVFSDTPGILDPSYKLHENMMKYVFDSLKDADVLLFMTEAKEQLPRNQEIWDKIQKVEVPMLVLINKIDLSDQSKLEKLVEFWHEKLPKAEIIPISALHGFNTDFILPKIVEYLPESPPYYDKEDLTDRPLRFFITELIREQILLNYDKEIPYSVEVEILGYKENEDHDDIQVVINVERNTQKGIIIGHQGQALKRVIRGAQKNMEKFLHKKVKLDVNVKVDNNWRNKETKLKRYGY